jgi:hypothetical protein
MSFDIGELPDALERNEEVLRVGPPRDAADAAFVASRRYLPFRFNDSRTTCGSPQVPSARSTRTQ